MNNPERTREIARQWYARNPEKGRAISLAWYRRNREYAKQYRLEHREKFSAYGRNWRRQFLDVLDAEKVAAGCADCGYNKHPQALHFDHLPGTEKKFGLAQASRHSWAEIKAERAKCEVVCANCHAVRTALRRKPTKLEESEYGDFFNPADAGDPGNQEKGKRPARKRENGADGEPELTA